jgi:hypothetical protein
VSITLLGAGGEGGPSIVSLWQVEGGDGRSLARAAVSLLEFISGPERGVVVYQDGKAS